MSGAQLRQTAESASGVWQDPPAALQYWPAEHSAASHWFLFEHVPAEHEVHTPLHPPSFASVVPTHEPDEQSWQSDMHPFPVSAVIPAQSPPEPVQWLHVAHSVLSSFALFTHEPDEHDVHVFEQPFPVSAVIPAQSPPAALHAWHVAHSVESPCGLLVITQLFDEQDSDLQSSCGQFPEFWQHVTDPGPVSPAQSVSAQSVSPSPSLSFASVHEYELSGRTCEFGVQADHAQE